jgi:hypothetical protein
LLAADLVAISALIRGIISGGRWLEIRLYPALQLAIGGIARRIDPPALQLFTTITSSEQSLATAISEGARRQDGSPLLRHKVNDTDSHWHISQNILNNCMFHILLSHRTLIPRPR